MARPKIKIWIYKNQELIDIANSKIEASKKTNVKLAVIDKIIKKEQECTRNGLVFTTKQLTNDEIHQLPVKEEKEDTFFYFQTSNRKKIQDFKTFLYPKLKERWMKIPKNLAEMERNYIKEFLNTLI